MNLYQSVKCSKQTANFGTIFDIFLNFTFDSKWKWSSKDRSLKLGTSYVTLICNSYKTNCSAIKNYLVEWVDFELAYLKVFKMIFISEFIGYKLYSIQKYLFLKLNFEKHMESMTFLTLRSIFRNFKYENPS